MCMSVSICVCICMCTGVCVCVCVCVCAVPGEPEVSQLQMSLICAHLQQVSGCAMGWGERGGQERKAVSAGGVGDESLSSGCLCPARDRGVASGSWV